MGSVRFVMIEVEGDQATVNGALGALAAALLPPAEEAEVPADDDELDVPDGGAAKRVKSGSTNV